MTSDLKLFFIALAVSTTGAQPVEAQEHPIEELQSWTVVEKGQDVFVRLSYSGELKDWDAAFRYDGVRLNTVNSAFITVSGPEGKDLAPRADKLLPISRNMWAKEPFNTRVNLTDVYDMAEPGRYVVEWGCKKVASQVIRIQVVEKLRDSDGAHAERAEQGHAADASPAP